MPQDFARILLYVGLPVDEVFKDEESFTIKPQLFAVVEELLLRQPVLIPSLGLGVEANEAAWILSLSVLALLVLLRSRVDGCLKRLDSGIEQPWLILDAGKGVERVVAGGWLLTIGMSTWVANGSLLVQLVSKHYGQGHAKNGPNNIYFNHGFVGAHRHRWLAIFHLRVNTSTIASLEV